MDRQAGMGDKFLPLPVIPGRWSQSGASPHPNSPPLTWEHVSRRTNTMMARLQQDAHRGMRRSLHPVPCWVRAVWSAGVRIRMNLHSDALQRGQARLDRYSDVYARRECPRTLRHRGILLQESPCAGAVGPLRCDRRCADAQRVHHSKSWHPGVRAGECTGSVHALCRGHSARRFTD